MDIFEHTCLHGAKMVDIRDIYITFDATLMVQIIIMFLALLICPYETYETEPVPRSGRLPRSCS